MNGEQSAGQGETAEQGLSAESLRDVRARAEALASIGHGFHEQEPVNVGSLAWANSAAALARDAIALTLAVERLLVRVQEADEEIATAWRAVQKASAETDAGRLRVQEAERALRQNHETLRSLLDAEAIALYARLGTVQEYLAGLSRDGDSDE